MLKHMERKKPYLMNCNNKAKCNNNSVIVIFVVEYNNPTLFKFDVNLKFIKQHHIVVVVVNH